MATKSLLYCFAVLSSFVLQAWAASSFSYDSGANFFTFSYSTSEANSKNWIGVYRTSGGGPVDGKYVEDSLVWDYAPGSSGKVHIPAGNMAAGNYKVFFLANDGYRSLANSQTVNIPSFSSSFSRVGSNTFSFSYKSSDISSKNWIGIYKRDAGPVDGVQVAESLLWKYAGGAAGNINIDADALQWGDYRAFYLQRDGYRSLTSPMNLNIPVATGTLSWRKNADLFTFDYTTTGPSTRNWIGIYPANGGPVNQVAVDPSILWAYASGSSGTVTLSAGDIPGGNYKAFFLARDEYKWICNPIDISVSGIRFPVKQATLRNARRNTAYEARVGGLVIGDISNVRFEKISGDGWVSVGGDGLLKGTPTSTSSSSTIVVRAIASSGATADLTVIIPIRDPNFCMVQDIRLMTYNMWYGGTKVKFYHEKQLRAILTANADVIALQEADPGRPEALSRALGWNYHQSGRTGIISRYPIVATSVVGESIQVRVAFDGTRQQINVWNAHLTAYPYGPYAACSMEGYGPGDMNRVEQESKRPEQIKVIVSAMSSHIAARATIPVFLMGDFNSPSHLDWISSLTGNHCGISSYNWPASRVPTDAGLIDSYRAIYPNPINSIGNTWSPIYPQHDGDTGGFEPQDRIDFIYHGSGVTPLASQTFVMGKPAPHGLHESNEWTSDHAAVITTYRINAGSC